MIRSDKGPASPIRRIVRSLTCWFALNRRDLPWRRTRDPYAIWVSEVMLQQTQVKTVTPYWLRWMKALPDVRSLAKATPARLHKLWEGLGYYTRVRNMQRAAQLIVDEYGGVFPKEFDRVLALPGVGRYTAGAVCSIAYNEPKPILDGNVTRVLARVFAIRGEPRSREVAARLWGLAEDLVKCAHEIEVQAKGRIPAGRKEAESRNPRSQSHPTAIAPNGVVRASDFGTPSVFGSRELGLPPRHENAKWRGSEGRGGSCAVLNQSLMELGALVCTAKGPKCDCCPIARLCAAHRLGREMELPERPRPVRPTRRRFIAVAAQRGDKFLVRQRPDGVVNAHLWEFPNVEVERGKLNPLLSARSLLGREIETLEHLCTIKHSITLYRITLDVFRAEGLGVSLESDAPRRGLVMEETARTDWSLSGDSSCPNSIGEWRSLAQLDRLAFSSAHKRILEALKDRGGGGSRERGARANSK